MEGDPVTLESGVAQLQDEVAITWQFGHKKTRIARIIKDAEIFNTSDGDAVGFRERLKLDHQTGSLTIINTTTADSGPYQLIFSGKTKITHTFNVNVYAHLPAPVITSKSSSSSQYNCSVLCSVVNVSAASLSWYKGNSLFSRISVSDLSNILPLDLECLDDSYSCVVNISFTNQTTHLSNTELCQPCPEPHIILITAGAIAVSLLILAIVGIIWICRDYQKTDQKEPVQKQTRDDHREDEITYAAPTFYKKHVQKSEDEVVYAGIVTRR